MTENKTGSRMVIVDALRGFSLAGIVFVHMTENYIGSAMPQAVVDSVHGGILDYVVDGINYLFLRGKFFALFSFLFGLSFFIQMDSAHKKGLDFRNRFIWRLILLFIIGYAHHLFYRGDILTIYAVLGFFLIPYFKVSNKYVLASAIILFLGIGRYIAFMINPGINLFMPGDYSPTGAEALTYYEFLRSASLSEVMMANAWEGMLLKLDFQIGVFSRAYLTFGFFLLGLYIGREQWFRNFRDKKLPLNDLLWISGTLFFVALGIAALGFSQMTPGDSLDNWYAMMGLTGLDLNNLGMTGLIVALFIIVYRKKWGERFLSLFAPYGRMALTNYVAQSLAGIYLFYGWGMGLMGTLLNRYTFLLAFLVVIVQMVISAIWLRYFHYGPLEWVWRSLTHFRYYPFKKTS